MRQDIINKVNRLSKASGTLNIDVLKMYDLIFNYCKKNKKNPSKVECSLNNGILVIDGNNIERVTPLVRPFMVENPEADYYENRILARAGLYEERP